MFNYCKRALWIWTLNTHPVIRNEIQTKKGRGKMHKILCMRCAQCTVISSRSHVWLRSFKWKLKQRKDEKQSKHPSTVRRIGLWIVWMGSILLTMQKLFCFIIVLFNCYYKGLAWNLCSFIRIMCAFAIYPNPWHCLLPGM